VDLAQAVEAQFGWDLRICRGTGTREDPLVLEACSAEEAAWGQVLTLRGAHLLSGNVLWRAVRWEQPDGEALGWVVLDTVEYTAEERIKETKRVFFDARSVLGCPFRIHPVVAWQGPKGGPVLPYELGWLHYDGQETSQAPEGSTDHACFYSAPGVKATVFVYDRPAGNWTRESELHSAVAGALESSAEWTELGERDVEAGPFVMRSLTRGQTALSLVGVAQCNAYFVKLRLTFEEDEALREMVRESLQVLYDAIALAVMPRH
jgi:hypothetical protein